MASSNSPVHDGDINEDDMDGSEEDLPTPGSANKGKRKADGAATGSGSKSRKKTRSSQWEHYTRLKDNYDKCNCNYCGKEMSCRTTSGTSNLKKHIESCKEFVAWKQANTDKTQTVIEPTGDAGNLSVCKVSEFVVREATNELMVLAELPLAFVEGLGWRHFCSRVKLPRPHSRRTGTRDIVEMFVRRKAAMKKILEQNKQRLSLTTDIWVAPHTASSYMVIIAHFIDSNWQLRKFIIGFKNVQDHKGSTIANCLLECLSEWGIRRVFTITVDNATANTNAMVKFKEAFNQLGDEALVLKGEFLHLRCATHILNLIVKEGLQEIKSSVAGIRNAITYVRSSSIRLKSFEFRVETGKITRGSLPLDVATRWNSTYLMLEQAMKFRVAFEKMEAEDKPYNDYFIEVIEGKKRVGPPYTVDWNAIERLVQFLIIFYNSTLILSASTSVASHKIYNEIVTISRNVSRIGSSSGDDFELRGQAAAMATKLDKYWNPFDDPKEREMNKLVIVASVFDPRKKMKFAQLCFEKLYGKDSMAAKRLNEIILDILKRLFDEYSGLANKNNSAQSEGATSSQSEDQARDEVFERTVIGNGLGYERMDNIYEEFVQQAGFQDANSSNELELYLKENVEKPKVMSGSEYDLLSWWKRNSPKYPVLSHIARDILAMQVSSVASESAFSTSGRVLEPSRSCLTHYTIEVLMCLEQWLKCEIHINEKGVVKNEQLLADIELQDELMREFDDAFQFPGQE